MKINHYSHTEYVVSGVYIEDLFQQRFCVFDFEATGPDPDNDYITQIGAVVIDSYGNLINQYTTLVRSPKLIPEKIEKLTGIHNKDLIDAPKFADAYYQFKTFAEDCVLVTQAGYEYDFPLMSKECERNNLQSNEYVAIDTKALFTYLYPDVTDVVSTN